MRCACQLVALFMILAAIAPPSPSQVAACSPTRIAPSIEPTYPPTVITTSQRVTTRLRASDAVFRGTVIVVDGAQGAYHIPSSVTFHVTTVWKGMVNPVVTVRNANITLDSPSDCNDSPMEGYVQYRAFTGNDTIVFAGQGKDGKWYFNTGTQIATDEYEQILGVGMSVATATTRSQAATTSSPAAPSESGVRTREVPWITVGGSIFVVRRRSL